MPNEQGQTPAVQDEALDSQAQTSPEPVDIAQAFQYLREANKETAQPASEEGEPVAPADNAPAIVDEGPATGGSVGDSQAEPSVPDSIAGDESIGGSSTDVSSMDYQAVGQGIAQRVREQARQEVLKEFQDHNIKIVSINDIYERDEDGTVRFNNPDDPRHPFESRQAAQAWVDSMNTQINNEYQTRIAKRAGELWMEAQPQIQLLQFAPYYERMDEVSQNVFDSLIEPYSIVQNGKVVGFNCNLAQMAQQAVKIANQFKPKQTQQQVQKPAEAAPKAPAMDMKSGTGETDDNPEPKNINEAMALLNKQRKEGKKNG